MTEDDFEALNEGDVVRSKSMGMTYIVAANYGNRVMAVRVVDMVNPREWELISRAVPVEKRRGGGSK